MDCAKGINFVLTNGGTMKDYWGYGKALRSMLPMIAVPTTAGTGSEAQSYALISDSETHVKMACGDPKAAFRAAILDPKLTVSQPAAVTAATGYDAISHAVETLVSTRGNAFSECFSREAWRLLNSQFRARADASRRSGRSRRDARRGAFRGARRSKIRCSGATHACANPLTAHYDIPHGVAIALLLSHVVDFNSPVAGEMYGDLHRRRSGRPPARSGGGGGSSAVVERREGSRGSPAASGRGSERAVDRQIQSARVRFRGGARDLPMRVLGNLAPWSRRSKLR